MDGELRALILAQTRGRCAAAAVPACWRTATSAHHRLTRSRGGRLIDAALEAIIAAGGRPSPAQLSYATGLCEPCHRHAHDSGEGYRLGLLVRGRAFTALDGTVIYQGPDEQLSATWPSPDERNASEPATVRS